MAQTPPLFTKSPFHRFGVRMNKKAETVRDRRLSRDEEKRLLDTALQKMNAAEHQFVGELLHDRIIGALELCCRRGEMLLIQNKRVNWDTCQIGIPGATAKDKENRRIPFNPKGRLAAILERRATLGPEAYVFGSTNGDVPAEDPDGLGDAEAAGARHRAAEPADRRREWNREQLRRIDLRWHDLGTKALPAARGRRRHPHHPTDARPREHSADAALLERDGRRTAERTGGELEQQRPTASGSVRTMKNGSIRRRICPKFVPGGLEACEKWAPRAGFEPATLRLTAGCSTVELPRNAGGTRAGANLNSKPTVIPRARRSSGRRASRRAPAGRRRSVQRW